jgi:predicted GIY-YIG superfamily endonuclease
MAKHIIHVYWEDIVSYIEENGKQIPEDAGIYEILVKKKSENTYMRRYIGQTNDLRSRFFKHLSDEEENEDIRGGVSDFVCGFDYAELDSESDRKDAEQKIYDKYEYPWNKERPEGSGRNLEVEVIEHSPGE